MPYHTSQKHRHSSTFSRDGQRKGAGPSWSEQPNDTERSETKGEEIRKNCAIEAICNFEHFDGTQFPCSISVTSAATRTLATPTPVKRASSSSCRRGSRLCSSSIMAAETRPKIKDGRCGVWCIQVGATDHCFKGHWLWWVMAVFSYMDVENSCSESSINLTIRFGTIMWGPPSSLSTEINLGKICSMTDIIDVSIKDMGQMCKSLCLRMKSSCDNTLST